MRQYEVIIPVRNGGQALVNSIESILAAPSAGQILLTISDNFSTDGSPWKTALKQFPQEQWRIISPPQPLGRVEHWSWAFGQGQLPWIKPLMTGDRVEIDFWNQATTAIFRFQEAGIFFSAASALDPSRAHPETAVSTEATELRLYSHKDFMWDALRCLNPVGALSQVLVRADILRAALPFDFAFPWTADWRFYKRCLQQSPAVQSCEQLVCLDRSIARLSTSWKGVRGSFREEWKFAASQAVELNIPSATAFWLRSKALGLKMCFAMGKRILPRSVRAFLTTSAGLYGKETSTPKHS
jgi:hypothetical protein